MTEPDGPPFVDLYFTFGIKYESEPDPYLRAAHPDGWLRVRGHDYEEAWDAGFRLTGNQHAFDYPVEHFHPERFPRGELMFCDLTSGERPPEPMPEGLVERMQEAVKRDGAPRPRRPYWEGKLICGAVAPHGRGCTLAPGHEGPHSAGGPKAPDGLCEVYAEWSDES